MSEQVPQRPLSDNDREGWKVYWAALNMPWRTEPEIDEERQQYLAKRRAVQPDTETGIYPFRNEQGSIKLNRADVEWLLATHEDGRGPVRWEEEKDKITYERRVGMDVRGADLRAVDLSNLPLARLRGGLATGEWLRATIDQRESAAARLELANLGRSQMQDAILGGTHLEGVELYHAYLQGAHLREAHLEASNCRLAHLEAVNFRLTHLSGADLTLAYFDDSTNLKEATLSDQQYGYVSVADVRWSGVNLGVEKAWSHIKMLGDEYKARQRRTKSGSAKSRPTRTEEFETAVRANRQLATALREQGLNEQADRFAYRAQLLQQIVLRRESHLLKYFGSLVLWLISGYGYRPLRSFITYLLVVGAFAVTYYLLGNNVHPPLDPLGAMVFSITSFHGRGFAPGESVLITNPLTILAAVEAIIGLLIEITFIATFTQRFFAR